MLITKKKVNVSNFSIKINETELVNCDSYKYLGVYFDKDLNWKTHINYISEEISKSCGLLSKLRHCLEIDTLREVYHALIHSYLRYGIIAWGSAPKTVLNQLNVIVNRAIRLMSFAPFGLTRLNPLYEILEILKVDDIYTLEVAKFAYKQNSGLLPIEIAHYFENQSRENNVRRSSRLNSSSSIAPSSSFGLKSVQYIAKQLWDEIPHEIRCSLYFSSFKKMYKSHLNLLYI